MKARDFAELLGLESLPEALDAVADLLIGTIDGSAELAEPTRQAEISYAVFCLKKKNVYSSHLRDQEHVITILCRPLLGSQYI